MFQEGRVTDADRLMRTVVRKNPSYAGNVFCLVTAACEYQTNLHHHTSQGDVPGLYRFHCQLHDVALLRVLWHDM